MKFITAEDAEESQNKERVRQDVVDIAPGQSALSYFHYGLSLRLCGEN
jgi:hypothetical protein